MRAHANTAAGEQIISKYKNYNDVFSDSIQFSSLYAYMLSSITESVRIQTATVTRQHRTKQIKTHKKQRKWMS
jgi:hypothetical protein